MRTTLTGVGVPGLHSSCSCIRSAASPSPGPGPGTRAAPRKGAWCLCRSLQLLWEQLYIPACPCEFQFVSSCWSSWVLVFLWFLQLVAGSFSLPFSSWPVATSASPLDTGTAAWQRLLHWPLLGFCSLWFLQLSTSGVSLPQPLPQLLISKKNPLFPASHCGSAPLIKP